MKKIIIIVIIILVITTGFAIYFYILFSNNDINSNKYEYGFELKIESNELQNYSIIIPINEGWEDFIIKYVSIKKGNCSYSITNTSYGNGIKIESNTNLHLKIFKESNKPLIKYNGDLTLLNKTNGNIKAKIFCNTSLNNNLTLYVYYHYLFTTEYKGNPHTSGINQFINGIIINGWQEIEISTELYD